MQPTITFATDSDGTMFTVFQAIAKREFHVMLAQRSLPFASIVAVTDADDDSITVCPVDDGFPLRSLWSNVPYADIESLVIL